VDLFFRDSCQSRLARIEGADIARVAVNIDDVGDARQIVPQIQFVVDNMDGLPDSRKSVVFGKLAEHFFSLRYLDAHTFAAICEKFHQQPWPPHAASGLLRRIGWITDAAKESLTELGWKSS
jgi:hypothetical protein